MTREEALAKIRALRGPPFRMTITYPLPALTAAEEAGGLATAEHEDIMGNVEPEPEDYTTMRALNKDDALREAEQRWRSRQRGNAIGYAVWAADWGCVHSMRIE